MFTPPKLYVMIKPPEASRRQTCGCRIANRLDEHYDPARFHSTMLRLGSELDWPPAALARLSETFDAVRFDPFAITFDQIEGRILRGAKGSAATRFHATLRKHAQGCGVQLPEHTFWLHMTLAYEGPAIAGIRKLESAIGWTVDEFLLIRSGHGRHDLLGRWPLFVRQGSLF